MKEQIRLNVFLAHAGLCSRRMADELIKKGEITINHGVIKEPGYKIKDNDTVRYKKKVVKLGAIPLVTIALNKPAGFITTVSDDKNRETVMDLLDSKIKTRVYPIGRLDRNTTGLLLLTNDGDLANGLAHPKFNIKKVYHVTLSRELTDDHLELIKKGVRLVDGFIKVDNIARDMQKYRAKVTLHSGKYRIVRRIFESLGYTVRKLDRINFGGITKKGLPEGQYRFLSKTEVDALKKFIPKTIPKSSEKKPKKSGIKRLALKKRQPRA